MIEGTGNIGVEFGPNGVVVADNSRSPRLFKIVSGSNPYTANEVALIEADGSKLLTGNYEVTAAQKVLWEVNGNTSVPADTIVEATPNPFGGGFYFSYAGSGGDCALGYNSRLFGAINLTGGGSFAASPGASRTVGVIHDLPAGSYLFNYSVMFNVTVDSVAGRPTVSAFLLANGGGFWLQTTYTIQLANQFQTAVLTGTGMIDITTAQDVSLFVVFGGISGNFTHASIIGLGPVYEGNNTATNLTAVKLCPGSVGYVYFPTPSSPPTSPPPPPTIPPPPPGTASISGHVNSDWPDYDPVIGRTVTLSIGNTGTTTTDSAGWYQFTSLSPGLTSVTLDTDSPGEIAVYSIDDGEWQVGSDPQLTVVANTDHDVDFRLAVLNNFAVSGTVTDNTGPTAYPGRVLTAVQGATTHTATTDGSGGYTFGSLFNSTVTIQLSDLGGAESAEHNLDSAGWVSGAATFTPTGSNDLDWRISGSVVSPPVPPPPP